MNTAQRHLAGAAVYVEVYTDNGHNELYQMFASRTLYLNCLAEIHPRYTLAPEAQPLGDISDVPRGTGWATYLTSGPAHGTGIFGPRLETYCLYKTLCHSLQLLPVAMNHNIDLEIVLGNSVQTNCFRLTDERYRSLIE